MKFKTGDKVRVLNKTKGRSIDTLQYLEIGDIVIIEQYYTREEHYITHSLDGNNYIYYFNEEDLTPMGISIL